MTAAITRERTFHDEIRVGLKTKPADVPELRERLVKLANSAPWYLKAILESHPFFLAVYLGFDVEKHHRDGIDLYLTKPRSMWLAPRGSGKSTIAVVFVLWLAISRPENRLPEHQNLFPDAPREITPANIRIALTSNSADKAIELHWQIRNLLKNERLVKLYGDLVGSRWTDHKSTTALREADELREGTFTALGLGSKVTGGHYDLVLLDDWITEDNARTELLRRRIFDFWAKTVKPTCEPWARVCGAGTRYHPQDFYHNVKQWVDSGLWDGLLHHRAIIERNGREFSYWPKAYSLDKLKAIRDEIGTTAFATQYQNEVDVMRGDFFQLSQFENTYEYEELPGPVRHGIDRRTVIALDPAIKAGPKNDYSVFTVTSYAPPNFYVREVVRGQWTEDEHLARLEDLVRRYRPSEVGIEVVGGVEFLLQRLQRLPWCPRIVPLRPTQFRGKDKVGRASRARVFMERGRVFFPKLTTTQSGVRRLIEEALAFPTSSNVPGMDDCVDSFVWSILLITRGRNRLIKIAR